jgi:hypothetical protein
MLTVHPSPHLCFFAGVFAGVFGDAGFFVFCELVSAPPSSSERPSSTSTVCVTASVPFTAGCAAAGAIVCVVGAVEVTDDDFPPRQPAKQSANVTTINTDSVAGLFTDTSLMDIHLMQFP